MPYKVKVVEKPQMLEINPGIWDGLSPEQAKKYYPEDWDRFTKDPYSFRAPRAESYHDLSGTFFFRLYLFNERKIKWSLISKPLQSVSNPSLLN